MNNSCCEIKTQLNFLFDLHGVLSEYPMLFRPMLKSLRCTNHKVYIASGSMPKILIGELSNLGYQKNLHYDECISVPEFLIKNYNVEFEFDEKGRPWTDDKTWWKSKSLICKKYNINLMIDDSIQYKEYLKDNIAFALLK